MISEGVGRIFTSDARSDEVAYRLKVENLGVQRIRLIEINPRIPEGVDLVEVKDSSAEAAKTRHEKLCSELTQLVEDRLFLTSEEIRSRIIAIKKEQLKETLQDLKTVMRAYVSMFTGTFQRQIERRQAQRSALNFKVEGAYDAKIAFEKWYNNDAKEADSNAEMFQAKLEQLEQIEKTIGTDTSATAIAVIEPESFFATTYVLRFKRSAINPKKFTFSVEANVADADKPEIFLHSATTSLVITPRPYILSIVSVVSALLGVALKFSFENRSGQDSQQFFHALGSSLITGPGISAIILALLLFNIYEYTDFGKNIKMGIGWRSALLIGVLCGLFSERIMGALKVLIGN
jgi:hypothetical protein